MKYSVLLLMTLMILPLVLSGCTGMALGAGATVGIKAAQEGGLEAAVNDTAIRVQINDLWFKYDFDTFRKLNLTINQGRVLITGVVQKPEARVEAVRLAWQASGVKEIINEIRVANSGGITGYARDTWITARLRAAITFDREIQSINYSIDTVQGIVYLMGVARGQAELDRVISIARTIPDVKQVVSYIKLSGENIGAPAPVQQDGGALIPEDSGAAPLMPVPGDYQPETYQSQGNQPPMPLVPEPVEREPVGGGY